MGDVSNWILTLSSFITRDIRRVSLVVLLLRSATWLIFHTHSHTHKIQNAFLILWQILSNSFVLHDRQHCSGKLCVIYYPPGRDWGDPQQQFLCRFCIVRGGWPCSVSDSVMMRCNTHQGAQGVINPGMRTALRRCPKITEAKSLLPVFGRAYS